MSKSLPEVLDEIESGRIPIKLGPKGARTVRRFAEMAHDLFPPDRLDEARDWVRTRLIELGDETNIKWLPDWIEFPLKRIAISISVDLAFDQLAEARSHPGAR